MILRDNSLIQMMFNSRILSWTIFLATLSIVISNLITVVFPAFMMGTITQIKFPVEINPYETGIWTAPFLITNFIIFSLTILYIKNKLPQQIKKAINFIFNFEIPKNVAILIIIVLLGSYIRLSYGELSMEDPWPDFGRYIEPALQNWTLTNFDFTVEYPYFALLLGNVSLELFGNYTTIPFIASISLLILTYLITFEISKKRFAGIVAMIIVLQSGIFYIYDTTITYSNFSTMFYLLAVYMIYKKWPVSPFSYVLSLSSKLISATFFPMILFFVARANVPNRKKILLLITYGVIAAVGLAGFFLIGVSFQAAPEFSYEKFLAGFTAFAYQFRFDGLIILFLLPLVFGLFLASRKGVKEADSIMIMLLGMFLIAVILPSITHFTNNPYRWVPFVVFFAIGVGSLLSEKITKSLGEKSSKLS